MFVGPQGRHVCRVTIYNWNDMQKTARCTRLIFALLPDKLFVESYTNMASLLSEKAANFFTYPFDLLF